MIEKSEPLSKLETFEACGSVTFVQDGNIRILVDCGGPLDKEKIVDNLRTLCHCEVDQIDHVVLTHGHLDHVGNMNIFPARTVQILGIILLFISISKESKNFVTFFIRVFS